VAVSPSSSPVPQEGRAPLFSPHTILCLGDSLTAGYGLAAPATQSFPGLLQEKIQAAGFKDAVVINAGLSGDTSAGGLRRIDWLLRQPVGVLVLALGANDGLRGIPTEETQRNLQGIIDKVRAKQPGVQVIIAGMRLPPNFGADYTDRFERIFPALAEINHAQLVPFLLKDVGGIPGLNQQDGMHPTAEGQRIVAETVWTALRSLIVPKQS
jgi:acyl-CoA thioesterase-1